MPRFVILQHDSPGGLHWDLMFDEGELLATWSLPLPPHRRHSLEATELPPHRRDYLDHTGPVSGDRGTVARWDAGLYTVLSADATKRVYDLAGEKLVGRALLRKTDDSRWQFFFASADEVDELEALG